MALRGRRQRFVEEYLLDLNAAAAYERAGYKVRSPHQASANAARLMAIDSIQEAIAAARQQQQARLCITADDVARGFQKEATWYGDDSSASARVSAWRELGKLLGFYPAEKNEHRFPDGIPPVQYVRVHVAGRDAAPVHDGNGRNT